MKNITKRLLTLILCLGLITSSVSVAFAEDKEKVLTFIGDSITYNFPNYHNWESDLETTYSYIVANNFGYTVSGGGDNGYEPLAMPGGRTTDLLAAISNSYGGDDYTIKRLMDKVESKQSNRNVIKNSDIITIQLGYSNFSVHFLNNLEYILGSSLGEALYFNTDLSQLITSKDKQNYLNRFNNCMNSLSLNLGKKNLDKIKNALIKNSDDVNEILSKLKQVYEAFRYAYISELVHFDASIKEIRKINKNADIYVMGLMNPADNLTLSFSISGYKITIPIYKLFDVLFSSINTYMRSYSPQRWNYTFVEPSKNVETYGDVFGRVNDTSAQNYTKSLLNSMFDNANGITNDCVIGAMKIASQKTLDLGNILDGDLISELSEAIGKINDKEAIYEIFTDVGKGENVSAADKLVGHAFLITGLQGIYVHPTQAGHNAMAQQLSSAIKLNQRKPRLFNLFKWLWR